MNFLELYHRQEELVFRVHVCPVFGPAGAGHVCERRDVCGVRGHAAAQVRHAPPCIVSRVTCNTRPGPGGRLYTCEAGGCDHALEEEEVAAMEAQLEQEMETTDCSDPDVIQVMVVVIW